MIFNIIFGILVGIITAFALLFFVFVIIYLGGDLLSGYIREFKARKYIKEKYPIYKIDSLGQEVLQKSVLCDIHNSEERLFGSLKFRNKKIIDELYQVPKVNNGGLK